MTRPTPEQLSVIESAASQLVVVASAGAGKTFTLVSRYLKLVQDQGLAPTEILTITFTRKAAAEMKERIVRSLRQAGLTEAAQLAETGPVSTIHSFCDRVLRENAIAAGLDPQFEAIEGDGYRSLLDQCLKQVLNDWSHLEPTVKTVIHRLAGVTEFRTPEWSGRLISRISDILDDFRSSVDRQEMMAAYGNADSTLAYWHRQILGESGKPELEQPEFLQRANAELRKLGASSKRSSPDRDLEEAELTSGLVLLACHVWHELDRRMDEEQRFDHAALERMAVQLVETNEEVRSRLQKRYRCVLVDETQDVNPWQYRLIDAMGIDHQLVVGDPQQSIYRFRSADPTLFTERARSTPTMNLSQNFRSTQPILAFIDRCFGTFWGDTYRPLLAPETDAADPFATMPESFHGVEFWETSHPNLGKVTPLATAALVRELLDEGVKLADIAILCHQNSLASQVHRALNREGMRSRILGGSQGYYSRMEVRDLANMIEVLTGSFDVIKLLAALHSPIIGLSLDACVRLANEADPFVALAELQPGPDGRDAEAIGLIQEWMMPMRAYGDRMTAWELVAEILRSTPFLARIARRPDREQQIANVRKLQAIAASNANATGRKFAESLRDIVRLRHRENDAISYDRGDDAAIISTIHKSKGLEFKVVVLPFLNQWKENDKAFDRTERKPATGLIVASEGGKSFHGVFRSLRHHAEQREENQEILRQLYVAMTRARERLCLGVLGEPVPNSIASRILSTVGDNPPGIKVRSPNLTGRQDSE